MAILLKDVYCINNTGAATLWNSELQVLSPDAAPPLLLATGGYLFDVPVDLITANEKYYGCGICGRLVWLAMQCLMDT